MIPAPAPANVQTLAGHMTNWLRRVGYPVPDAPQVVYTDNPEAFGGRAGDGALYAGRDEGRVVFGPTWRRGLGLAAQRLGQRGAVPRAAYDPLATLMHEQLHGIDSTPGPWNEAAVEAVSRDLMPAFMYQMYGVPPARQEAFAPGDYDGPYDAHVRRVRAMSARATGGPVGARAARLWRRRFLVAPAPQREALIARWGAP